MKVNGLKNDDPKVTPKCPVLTEADLSTLRNIIEEHEEFITFITDIKLSNIHDLNSVADGNTIMVMYDIKGGKHIKSIIDECINY